MNYDQIENNEVRIFPFYKGKYMGKTELGFSNKKSAQKFMFDIPENDIYAEFGGKTEYKRTHNYVHKLDKTRRLVFNSPCDWGGKREFDGIWTYDYNTRVYLTELPEEIVADIKAIGWYAENEKHEMVKAFEEKWDLFPHIETDTKDFDSMHRKYMRDKVEYRKGIVHINIEYIDE